jgi:hypothetical protein
MIALLRELKRLQVLIYVVLLLINESKVEPLVVTVRHIKPCFEPAVVIQTSCILREHKLLTLADEDAGEIHCPIAVYLLARCIGFEANRAPASICS